MRLMGRRDTTVSWVSMPDTADWMRPVRPRILSPTEPNHMTTIRFARPVMDVTTRVRGSCERFTPPFRADSRPGA